MKHKLVDSIITGIQEKKGRGIVVCDLTKIEDTICQFFVVCEGNSPNQLRALVDSIKEEGRKTMDESPIAVQGLENCEWVAMDYGDVMVHLFLPEARDHYQLETMWADAVISDIETID
ncbi:MAG TPA: ribosome silencing factor [Bacteroidaceae bacterium]|nr:ribosome silencing factor [Bacteroidaceae bacterium]